MKSLSLAILVSAFMASSAFAQTCESKAVGSDGKALAGAAKASFVKKCKKDACDPKAVSESGKKLTGAAKKSFMKKCKSTV